MHIRAPFARVDVVAMLASHVSAFARGDAMMTPQHSKRSSGARVTRVVEAKESRIGKKPVAVPRGVTYTLKDNHLAVKVRARGVSIATDGASSA